MPRIWIALSCALALALAAPAWAQEPRPPEPDAPPPQEGEEPLTPQEAMQLLREARDLMDRAETLLMESAAGREAGDPQATMQEILERLRLRMDRTQDNQRQAIEKLREVVRRAPT